MKVNAIATSTLSLHFCRDPRNSLGRVHALDAPVEATVLLCLVVALGALPPRYADVVFLDLVLRDLAVRLRLVVALGALIGRVLPLDVLFEGVVFLRLVVAVRALLLINADDVLVGLVQRDAAVRLDPVFAALVVTEPPESIACKLALCCLRVLSTFALYSHPSSVQACQVTPMPCTWTLCTLMWLSFFALYVQLGSGHSCQVTPISCTKALCCLMRLFCFALQAQGSHATQCRCCEWRPCDSSEQFHASSCTHTRQPRTSSTSFLRSPSAQPPPSPPLPRHYPSTLITTCPSSALGISNTSTLSSV